MNGFLIHQRNVQLVDGMKVLWVKNLVEGYLKDGLFYFRTGTMQKRGSYSSGFHMAFKYFDKEWDFIPVDQCQFFECDIYNKKECKMASDKAKLACNELNPIKLYD